MKNKKEFEFILQEEIPYSDDKGNAFKTKKLFLKAPSPKQRRYACVLQQKFMQAVKGTFNDLSSDSKQSQNNNKSESDKMDGNAIIAALLMSSIDINEMINDLKSLLTSGSCLIDGKIEICDLHFDMIGFDDIEKLLGDYIANFLLPSFMK